MISKDAARGMCGQEQRWLLWALRRQASFTPPAPVRLVFATFIVPVRPTALAVTCGLSAGKDAHRQEGTTFQKARVRARRVRRIVVRRLRFRSGVEPSRNAAAASRRPRTSDRA